MDCCSAIRFKSYSHVTQYLGLCNGVFKATLNVHHFYLCCFEEKVELLSYWCRCRTTKKPLILALTFLSVGKFCSYLHTIFPWRTFFRHPRVCTPLRCSCFSSGYVVQIENNQALLEMQELISRICIKFNSAHYL